MTTEDDIGFAISGAAQDIMVLVGLYDLLKPQGKRELLTNTVMALAEKWVEGRKTLDGRNLTVDEGLQLCGPSGPPWGRAANLLAYIGKAPPVAMTGPSDAQLDLISLYEQGNRTALMTMAVEAFAAQSIQGMTGLNGAALDVEEWLTDLAEDCFPNDCDAAGLIALLTDASGERRKVLFQDGMLCAVLCAFEDVDGSGPYGMYMHIRDRIDGTYPPAELAEYFRVDMSEEGFRHWDGDEWTFDQDKWQVEVDRQCIEEFEVLVGQWRTNFFAALLSGKHRAG